MPPERLKRGSAKKYILTQCLFHDINLYDIGADNNGNRAVNAVADVDRMSIYFKHDEETWRTLT